MVPFFSRINALRLDNVSCARFSATGAQPGSASARFKDALHTPEFECIGKGKARALRVRGQYRHPCGVSEGRTVPAPCQSTAWQSLRRHTLRAIADMENLTDVEARRIHVDKGYRGHNHLHRFRVWISGQVRRVMDSIRREMKLRAAVEPVIGRVKAEHRMDPTISRDASATASTLSLPLPDTTSACSCDGWQSFCASSAR
ncbi:hypothetical protein ABIB82_007467 [Bradyrhizobium sp. i1.8.4]